MKIIKTIALIMLSLFILSSCSQAEQQEPEQTTENNQSDTEQTVDEPIIRTPINDDYTVDLPKEEFLKQMETAYSEYYKNKYNYDTTFRIQKYYGTYDGVTAFFICGDGIFGQTWVTVVTIAGYTFTYGGSTRIEIMKNGEFFDMKDAYDKGIITEEYVAAVYNCTPAEYNIYT